MINCANLVQMAN